MTEAHGVALDRVLELTVLLGSDMASGLGAVGLTESRAPLVWLLHQQGPTTQRDLAASLGVTPRNVTGLVDALVETGFVTREPHPGDRRAVLVALTDHGRAVVEQMARDHAGLAETLFGGLDPAVFEGFRAGLDAVIERLHRALEEAHS
jgi:DNA-binding MarR family transcriptional regulator